MALRVLSQCSINRWMSLTALARVPHPARPNTYIMAPRYSDPGNVQEILSYQNAKVGH